MPEFGDGGPAFPVSHVLRIPPGCEQVGSDFRCDGEFGMSLRAFLAAHALQGLLANPTVGIEVMSGRQVTEIGVAACVYADLTLKALIGEATK